MNLLSDPTETSPLSAAGPADTRAADVPTDRFFSLALHLLLILRADGVILRLNPAARQLLGWEPADLVGRSCLDLVHPDDQAPTRGELAALRSGCQTRGFENRVRTRDGSWRTLAWAAVADPAGLIYGIGHDVTEQRRAEVALAESRAVYRTLTEVSPVGVFRAGPDGLVEYLNDRYCVITGYGVKTLAGDGWLRPLHPEDRTRVARLWRGCVQAASPFRAEFRFVQPGGEVVWVLGQALPEQDGEGRLRGFIGTITDIGVQKRTEAELRASERRLKQAEREARIGSWHLNLVTDRLIWSEGVYRLFGLPAGAPVHRYRDFLARVHPEDRAGLDAAFQAAIVARTTFDCTHRVLLPDGGPRWLQARATVRHSPSGLPLRAVGTLQDVTELRHKEDRLALTARRAEALLALPLAAERLAEADFMQHGQEVAEDLTGSSIAFIHFIHPDQRTTELVTWSRRTLREFCTATHDTHYPLAQAGVWADALRQRVPVVVNHYPNHPHKQGTPEGHARLQRLVSVPVIEQGRVVMLAGIGNKPEDYDDLDVETLQLVASEIWRIVQRNRTLARLRLVDRVFQDTADGVVITSASGQIVAVNPAFTAITGYSEAEVVGQTPRLLKSDRHEPDFYANLWASLLGTGYWRGELWNRRKDGTVYPEWLSISALRDDAGGVTHYVGVFSDMSAQKAAERRIEFLAQHDVLTGLPNRVLFQDRLEHALVQARAGPGGLALLFIDLDRFKVVNENLGHGRGDLLLREIAARLQGAAAPGDTLARLGGDEFALLLERRGRASAAASLAREVLDALAVPVPLDGRELVVTASIGISLYPDDGEDATTLLRYAEQALYAAKQQGRNTFAFFTPALTEGALERLLMEHALRGAVRRGELVLYYQPQVALTDGGLRGVEALVRWQHPDLGLVPPGRFIPLAEEIGLIGDIGAWVLETAVRQAGDWDAAGLRVPCIAVNLSAAQLEHAGIVAEVAAALRTWRLEPGRLELEVTESMLIRNPATSQDILAQLKALGVRLALDDFGTGYSNLSLLRVIALDRLKIDRSLIQDLAADTNDQAIVRAIIAMARSLGLVTVAEGVEDAAQVAFLQSEGADIAQGWLYGRPLPAADVLARWGTPAGGDPVV